MTRINILCETFPTHIFSFSFDNNRCQRYCCPSLTLRLVLLLEERPAAAVVGTINVNE